MQKGLGHYSGYNLSTMCGNEGRAPLRNRLYRDSIKKVGRKLSWLCGHVLPMWATATRMPPHFVLQQQHLSLVAVPIMDFLRRFFLRFYRDASTRFSLLMCLLMLLLLLLVWLFEFDTPPQQTVPLPPPATMGVAV